MSLDRLSSSVASASRSALWLRQDPPLRLLANRNRRQALALCRHHLKAVAPQSTDSLPLSNSRQSIAAAPSANAAPCTSSFASQPLCPQPMTRISRRSTPHDYDLAHARTRIAAAVRVVCVRAAVCRMHLKQLPTSRNAVSFTS